MDQRHDRKRSVTGDAMVGQDPVHQPLLSVGDIGQQQVLLGREANAPPNGLDHAAQRAPQPAVRGVADAAVLDEHAQERASLSLLVPPEMVLDVRHLDRCSRRERTTELTLHLLAKPVQSLLVEQVLEPRVAPVVAVTVIPLDFDHGLGHLSHLARLGESQRVGEPRIGVRLAVSAPHAAAHQHVESREPISLCDH